MINKKYLFVVFLFMHSIMLGQTVKVLHYQTKQPIENVQVHNRDKSISLYTNINGEISLNDFNINELVYFSHPSYEKEKKSISQIVTDGYRVLMFDLIELPTIVIKPPRENTREDFSSVRIEKIKSNEIQFSVPQTSADMLQKNSNIMVQKSQSGEEYDGTGIGLSPCKKIVEQHGGEISLQSKKGEGTVFHFTIEK